MNQKLQHIIEQGENETSEFKTSFNDEVIITLSALANTQGGTVYIGVEDNGTVKGVFIGKETIGQWLNEIKNKTAPVIMPDVETIEDNTKTVIALKIQEYPVKPISVKGKYFKRVKNTNHLLAVSEITEMHIKSLQTSWDAYPHATATFDDIDFKKVSIFIEKVNSSGRFSLPSDVFDALTKLKLIQNNTPTNAALLLFTKDNFNHNIHVGRFKTPDMIIDDKMLKGDLFTLVEETMQYIIGQIKVAFEITGKTTQRQEIFEYPIPALRELVMNAIVHRDYASPIDIQIKIFDQNITIYNPGKLFGNLTIEDLKTDYYQSNTRNKLIAEAFYLTKDIEKYGSGFIRIRKEIKSYPTMHYDYKEIANGFLVELGYEHQKTSNKSEKVVENVTGNVTGNVTENVTEKRIKKIIEVLAANNKTTTEQLANKLKVNKRTIIRDIEKLKKLNKIKYVGPAKGGYWQIIKNSNN